jgi:hypothetical protein
VQDLAKERGQAEVNQVLNFLGLEKISQFRMHHFWLGGQPLRLGGVRIYEQNTAPDEIVMDVDLIYSGDASLTFSLQGLPCEIKQVASGPPAQPQVPGPAAEHGASGAPAAPQRRAIHRRPRGVPA